MSKLSIDKSGFSAEHNIKDDAMRPTVTVLSLVLIFSGAIIIWSNNVFSKIFGAFCAFIALSCTIYLNVYFALKDTDRLHTERYLINRKIIEARLLEDKTKGFEQNLLSTNLDPTLTETERADKDE